MDYGAKEKPLPRGISPEEGENRLSIFVKPQDKDTDGNEESHGAKESMLGNGKHQRYKHPENADDKQNNTRDAVISFIIHNVIKIFVSYQLLFPLLREIASY